MVRVMLGTMPPELRSELSRMIATDQELVLVDSHPQPGTQDDGPSDLLIAALRAVAAGFVVLSPGDVAQSSRPEQDVQARNGDPV